MSELVVVDYNANWPDAFNEIRKVVWDTLADFAISVEHVGSTAVPGLSAKPVIDVDVIVPDDRVALGIARLVTLGYVHRGDQGIPQREVFKGLPHLPRHHLYLCPVSSPALWNHLAIRDYLRMHPGVAAEYGAFKKLLAQLHAGDMDGYVEAKTPFLMAILRNVGASEGRMANIVRENLKH